MAQRMLVIPLQERLQVNEGGSARFETAPGIPFLGVNLGPRSHVAQAIRRQPTALQTICRAAGGWFSFAGMRVAAVS